MFGELLKLETDLSKCQDSFNLTKSDIKSEENSELIEKPVKLHRNKLTEIDESLRVEKEVPEEEWEAKKEDQNLFYSNF